METFTGSLEQDKALLTAVTKVVGGLNAFVLSTRLRLLFCVPQKTVPELTIEAQTWTADAAQAREAFTSTWCRFVSVCCGVEDSSAQAKVRRAEVRLGTLGKAHSTLCHFCRAYGPASSCRR